MARIPGPYTIIRRTDSKSFRLTLNPSCGLPTQVCDEWYRRSFQQFPPELANHRNPKDKSAAKNATVALILFLKKKEEVSKARGISVIDITVSNFANGKHNLGILNGLIASENVKKCFQSVVI